MHIPSAYERRSPRFLIRQIQTPTKSMAHCMYFGWGWNWKWRTMIHEMSF